MGYDIYQKFGVTYNLNLYTISSEKWALFTVFFLLMNCTKRILMLLSFLHLQILNYA